MKNHELARGYLFTALSNPKGDVIVITIEAAGNDFAWCEVVVLSGHDAGFCQFDNAET